jgi:hypothetical protein
LVDDIAGVSAAEGSVDGTCDAGNEDPIDLAGDDWLINSLGSNVVDRSSKMKVCA